MITFNENSLPTGINVRSIVRSVLPEMSRQTVKIFGRAGSYGLAKEIGERVFTIEFIIQNDTEADYLANIRELARFLYTPEPAKLVINTEPDYYYMAMVDQATELEQLIDEVGTVQVEFYCSQPFAIKTGDEMAYTIVAPANNIIENNGDVPSSPIFKLNFIAPSTFVEFLNNTNRKSFRMGSAVRFGEQDPFADYTRIIDLACTDPALADVTKLTNGTQFNPSYAADGIVTAQMVQKSVAMGSGTQQAYGLAAADSWGSATGWHGAGIEKTLTTALNDYSVEVDIQMVKNNNQQSSKLEIYLYGNDGSEIAKLNFNDGGLGLVNPQLWCRFNDPNPYSPTPNDNNVICFTGTNAGALLQKYRSTKYYFNPNGIIRLKMAKRQNNWRIWIGRLDPNNFQVTAQDLFEINDPQGLFNQQDLKKVRITMGTYGTAATTSMYVHSIRVNQENAASYDPTVHLKYAFYAGDTLVVDMQAAKVYLNGEEDYRFIDPSSDFWKLEKGENDIAIFVPIGSVDNSTNIGQVWLNERYL